jgi:hypothetical protein
MAVPANGRRRQAGDGECSNQRTASTGPGPALPHAPGASCLSACPKFVAPLLPVPRSVQRAPGQTETQPVAKYGLPCLLPSRSSLVAILSLLRRKSEDRPVIPSRYGGQCRWALRLTSLRHGKGQRVNWRPLKGQGRAFRCWISGLFVRRLPVCFGTSKRAGHYRGMPLFHMADTGKLF